MTDMGHLASDWPGFRDWIASHGDEALRELSGVLEARREQRGDHGLWARRCEEVGAFTLAFREYQLALRDDPDDRAALARLSDLYEERGDLERALACSERLVRAGPADAAAARRVVELTASTAGGRAARDALARLVERGLAPDAARAIVAGLPPDEEPAPVSPGRPAAPRDGDTPVAPAESDVVRFAHLFSGRENVHARQWYRGGGQGGYSPVREPLTVREVRNHLLGGVTVGVYPIRLDDTVTFFAFDLDITKRALGAARGDAAYAEQLRARVRTETARLHAALARLGVPAIVEDSGYKGRHLWVFLEAPEPAAVICQFGSLFLSRFGPRSRDLHVEFFPRQANVRGGLGNLIKLPLGIHRRTGRRCRLLNPDGRPVDDPFAALRGVRRLERPELHRVIGLLKRSPAPAPRPGDRESRSAVPPEPAPPLPPAPWTDASFETDPEVSVLLGGCPALAALVRRVREHRRLEYDERVVVKHTLGHSGPGVLAVNHLLDQCVDTGNEERLQSPLAGNPISCPKIRKRIPHVTATVRCNCSFPFAADHYPTPRLHLEDPARRRPAPVEGVRPGERPWPASTESLGASARVAAGGSTATGPAAAPVAAPTDSAAGPAPSARFDAAHAARTLGVLRDRARRLEREIAELTERIAEHLEGTGSGGVDTGDGVLRLERGAGGIAALTFQPRGGGGASEVSPESGEDDGGEGGGH